MSYLPYLNNSFTNILKALPSPVVSISKYVMQLSFKVFCSTERYTGVITGAGMD